MSPTLIFGLTSLGVFHTLISLIAVAIGAIVFIRDGKISWNNSLGKIYTIATIIVCLTGFGIFQHDGFGKPHALGIITLLAFGVIWAAHLKRLGKSSAYVELVGYTLTFFFHIVPGITESFTRLPLDAPLASSPDDPRIQMLIGICFILFLIGAVFQVRRLRAERI